MCSQANPLEKPVSFKNSQKQTVEMRSPDGSADLFMLLAALAVAFRYGLEKADALDIAKATYVSVNIHQEENKELVKKLAQLPDSCCASAKCLAAQRSIYEEKGVFTPAMIDAVIAKLEAYHDETLRASIANDQAAILELVKKYFHC